MKMVGKVPQVNEINKAIPNSVLHILSKLNQFANSNMISDYFRLLRKVLVSCQVCQILNCLAVLGERFCTEPRGVIICQYIMTTMTIRLPLFCKLQECFLTYFNW